MTSTINIVLNNTKIMTDTLRDFKVVYLFYGGEKVGKMEFMQMKTPLQGNQYVLKSYTLTPDYSELFKGEESPLLTITNYVKTLIV